MQRQQTHSNGIKHKSFAAKMNDANVTIKMELSFGIRSIKKKMWLKYTLAWFKMRLRNFSVHFLFLRLIKENSQRTKNTKKIIAI